MRQAGRVTCAPKGCQEGEYTEGAGACKRLLPLECAVQAAVILCVLFTREGGRDRSRRIRKYVRYSNRDLKRLLEGRMTLSRSAFSKRFLESE